MTEPFVEMCLRCPASTLQKEVSLFSIMFHLLDNGVEGLTLAAVEAIACSLASWAASA